MLRYLHGETSPCQHERFNPHRRVWFSSGLSETRNPKPETRNQGKPWFHDLISLAKSLCVDLTSKIIMCEDKDKSLNPDPQTPNSKPGEANGSRGEAEGGQARQA